MIQSYSPPAPKNQRRKRKDHQSRDFICKCGKKYLSYPAAYTHVKSKHNGVKDYLENISQPDRVKLKRGRPKQRKIYEMTAQNEKLTIIEEAILLIFDQILRINEYKDFPTFVLEGNKQISQGEFNGKYQIYCQKYGKPANKIYAPQNQKQTALSSFVRQLVQHFQPQLAAKIAYFLDKKIRPHININKMTEQKTMELELNQIIHQIDRKQRIPGLWDDNQEIPKIIIDALQHWIAVGQKVENNEDNYINF